MVEIRFERGTFSGPYARACPAFPNRNEKLRTALRTDLNAKLNAGQTLHSMMQTNLECDEPVLVNATTTARVRYMPVLPKPSHVLVRIMAVVLEVDLNHINDPNHKIVNQ